MNGQQNHFNIWYSTPFIIFFFKFRFFSLVIYMHAQATIEQNIKKDEVLLLKVIIKKNWKKRKKKVFAHHRKREKRLDKQENGTKQKKNENKNRIKRSTTLCRISMEILLIPRTKWADKINIYIQSAIQTRDLLFR